MQLSATWRIDVSERTSIALAGGPAGEPTLGRGGASGSVFNAREPDDRRWDLDLGALDSTAGRLWFRPAETWEAQVSVGHLREPEALEPGDEWRTTASASWIGRGASRLAAFTAGYGVNAAHGERWHGAFGETTIEGARASIFGRVEAQQVETHLLQALRLPTGGMGRMRGATMLSGAKGHAMAATHEAGP